MPKEKLSIPMSYWWLRGCELVCEECHKWYVDIEPLLDGYNQSANAHMEWVAIQLVNEQCIGAASKLKEQMVWWTRSSI